MPVRPQPHTRKPLISIQIGIDPGTTTGYAVAVLTNGVFELLETGQIGPRPWDAMEMGYQQTAVELHRKWEQYFRDYNADGVDIVLEDFILIHQVPGRGRASGNREGISAVRVGTWVKSMIPIDSDVRLTLQQPSQISDKLPHMKAAWLKKHRLAAKGPHALDAVRHLVVFNRVLGSEMP